MILRSNLRSQLTPPFFRLRVVVTPALVGSGYKPVHSMIYALLASFLLHVSLEIGPKNAIYIVLRKDVDTHQAGSKFKGIMTIWLTPLETVNLPRIII